MCISTTIYIYIYIIHIHRHTYNLGPPEDVSLALALGCLAVWKGTIFFRSCHPEKQAHNSERFDVFCVGRMAFSRRPCRAFRFGRLFTQIPPCERRPAEDVRQQAQEELQRAQASECFRLQDRTHGYMLFA